MRRPPATSFAAAAVTQGEVTVEGLSRGSLQGDVAFCDCLERMGCEVRYGHNQITVVGAAAPRNRRRHECHQRHRANAGRRGPLRRKGRPPSATWPTSATKRPTALPPWPSRSAQARRGGGGTSDGLKITPRPCTATEIDTYDDHRMAMSLALVGLAVPGVVIRDPGCTAKTYPHFFRDLQGLGRR